MINENTSRRVNLKSIEILLAGQAIPITRLENFNIFWSIEQIFVEGSLTFVDDIGLIEKLNITSESPLIITARDLNANESITYNFKIVKIDTINSEERVKIFKLDFIDSFGYDLLAYYPNKAVLGKTVPEILSDEDILGKLSTKNSLTVDAGTSTYIFESFSCPMNKPFLNTLNYIKRMSNTYIFRNRTSLVSRTLKEMFSGTVKENTFLKYTENPNYQNKILDARLFHADAFKGKMLLSDARVFTFDILNKTNKPFQLNYSDTIKNFHSEENAQIYTSHNPKMYYRPYESHQNEIASFYENNAKDLLQVIILVPGTQENEAGQMVKIKLQGSVEEKYNKEMTGDWLIKSIKDIFRPYAFYQEITLIRPTPNKGT